MSKTRAAAKYTAAGAVTALYAAAIYATATDSVPAAPKVSKNKLYGLTAGLIAMTWLAALL